MTIPFRRVKINGTIMMRLMERKGSMAQEDDAPVKRRNRLEKLPLDSLGIEELQSYITELKEEILRVEADIGRKQGHRSAADAFFKPR
jgi:uncharacterized small protein (DUF1192 family)